MRRWIAVSVVAALGLAIGIGPANADSSSKAFELAAKAGDASAESAQPQAIPGIVALAVAAARLMTVARVPQAVTSMAKTAGTSYYASQAIGGYSTQPATAVTSVDKAFD